MEGSSDFFKLQKRVTQHNELAAKYRVQIDMLRDEAASEMDIWEMLLGQMFLQCTQSAAPDAALQEEMLRAALDFGFQCMGVGAVLAIDGLAQETIVI